MSGPLFYTILLVFALSALCLDLCTNSLRGSRPASSLHPHIFYSTTLKRQDASATQCGFAGNTDLYGLGIRVGYYTQAFSSWLANWFILQESKGLRATNTLFMVAMFLGLILISHVPSETHAIEAFLLLQILLAIWFVGVKDRSRWGMKHWKYDPVRAVIREVSVIAILVYNVWFWWYGLDAFIPTPCGTYILVLTKIDLYGWFRSAHKVLSIISISFQMVMATGDVFQLQNFWQTRTIRSSEHFSELADRLMDGSGAEDTRTLKQLSTANKRTSEQQMEVHYQDRGCSPILRASPTSPTLSKENATNRSKHDYQPSSVIPEVQITAESGRRTTATDKPSVSVLTSEHGATIAPPIADLFKAPKETPLFDSISAADDYVTSVLECPASKIRNYFSYHIPYTPITIYLPALGSLCPTFATEPKRGRSQVRLPLLIPLFIYVYNRHHYPFIAYPSLLSSALASPHHQSLDPSTLSTFLILHTTTIPTHTRKWYFVPSALLSFFISVSLVLAIEFCIYWNNITQTQDIRSVGQLVPLILGVGGLLKVIWSWIRDGRGEDEEGKEIDKEVERCAEVYYKLKAAKQKRGPSQQV